MKLQKFKSSLLIAIALTTCIFFSELSLACTGIQLKAKDGSFVNGRTDEFGLKMDLSSIFIPRNYTMKGTLPDGTQGLTYQSKYAATGAASFGDTNIIDGINEKGLVAAAFYFPGYAAYTAVDKTNGKKGLSPTEFTNWILTQFASVDEVKNNLKSVIITATEPKGWGLVPPLHYIVYDKQGKSIVIEPIDGQLKVYDNSLGIITNSPTFDWHITNLRNYVNLSVFNVDSTKLGGITIDQFGQGSGLHGLPGDFSPPSRFIRAAIFAANAIPSDNASQAVMQLFHILNQFDIPIGSVRSEKKDGANELTIATVVRDPQNLKFYYKTYDDQNIKVVDLKAFDFDSKTMLSMLITGQTVVENVSQKLK